MKVCLDTTALMCLLDPRSDVFPVPDGSTVRHMQRRMDHLVTTVADAKGSAIVPTPALAELLVGAGAQRAAMLRVLENRKAIRVEPFDKMAAVHCASLDSQAISDGDKKDGVRNSWQKVKIDRQIVAIAQVARCDRIVTGDSDVEKVAGRAAIETTFVWQLDLPPADAQIAMRLDGGDGPSIERWSAFA